MILGGREDGRASWAGSSSGETLTRGCSGGGSTTGTLCLWLQGLPIVILGGQGSCCSSSPGCLWRGY